MASRETEILVVGAGLQGCAIALFIRSRSSARNCTHSVTMTSASAPRTHS